jgi:hypothetical protein
MKKLLLLLSALIVCIFACCCPSNVYIFTCCPSSTPSSPTPIAEAATLQPSTVPPEPTDTPQPTPTATAIALSPDDLYPAPALVGPGDGSNFKPNDDILLIWDTPPTPLSEDEWYEVQLWRVGDVPYTVAQRTKEGTWKVEREYYPGRYQWRILIVRGQKDHKEKDLSRPSQTWSFSWLSPGLQTPTPPTSLLDLEAPVDLTVYLRGTNNAQGFATFSGEHMDAGKIYSEGSIVYGEVAVRIGDTVYHFDKEPAPGEPEQLPAPYRLEVKFSDSLIAATEGIQPGFNPKKAQFWVGTLKCNSAVSDKPYTIELTLYAGGEARKHTEISFLVADDPVCGGTPETERIWQPPPTYTPTPLYSPTPTPTPSCDLTVYLRGTNNAEGFAAFSGEHVDAGRIYTEGAYVYGEIAVRIGDNEYHYYEQEVCPPRRAGLSFQVEFKFSDFLLAATKGVEPQFNESNLRFWAGILDCNSATSKPYRIEATLYKDEKIRKHTEINFLVLDDPLCGVEAEEPEGIPIPTPRGRPRPP